MALPLNAKQRKLFPEACAREVLRGLLPAQFPALRCCDKPDLQDARADIGVEVTSAAPPHAATAAPQDPALAAGAGRALSAAVSRKIAKLNNKGDDDVYEYRSFARFGLFVNSFFYPDADRGCIEAVARAAAAEQGACARQYDLLYIYCGARGLWRCDLAHGTLALLPVSEAQHRRFRRRALRDAKKAG